MYYRDGQGSLAGGCEGLGMRTRTLPVMSVIGLGPGACISGERIVKGLDYVASVTDSCNGAVGVEWAAG